ncbi:MAG TPA: PP2C family protein-serine/threonine phosphatase [Thermoanaerobaculia bacterium]
MKETRSERTRLLIALGLGALFFMAGLALARQWIPEWQPGDLPDERLFVERYRETASRIGIKLMPGEPRVKLNDGFFDEWIPCEMRGLARSETVRSLCRGLRVEVTHRGYLPGRPVKNLAVRFSREGQPRAVRWMLSTPELFIPAAEPAASEELVKSVMDQLIAPGETLDEPVRGAFVAQQALFASVRDASPAQHMTGIAGYAGSVFADRRPGDPEVSASSLRALSLFTPYIQGIAPTLRLLGVAVLFIVLLSRRRIDLVNGAILAGITLLLTLPASLLRVSEEGSVLPLLGPFGRTLWVFLFWSASESFLRATDSSFTTSLDSLRVGRLGPRAGRALIAGLAVGAAVAGLALSLRALAMAVPALQPLELSVFLPVSMGRNPFNAGVGLAATAVMLLALARRVVPVRWIPWVAALAGALVLPPLRLQPWPFEVAANFLIFAVLVVFCRRYGLTALLTAAISAFLLPAAVFSGLHADWLPGTFAATAGAAAALFLLGLVGLQRSHEVEAERLKPPAFMRRLEEERRLKYEMDLLARMQEGLLPETLPDLPGWQIAARSILATEAGGDLYDFLQDDEGKLWIAAGDVAGHGYSCAIVQAMTTAALTSLITPGRTPSEVLHRVDRVIRRGGSPRNFASLALLRLDPATGEALLSNAGHPFPFLMVDGHVSEIVLPGLPLGQGPQRQYQDLEIRLVPGASLVFCSDGLIETNDWSETPYGFDRPQEILRGAHGSSAERILDVLLADWRRHLGSEEPPDDTTIVVVKRVRA